MATWLYWAVPAAVVVVGYIVLRLLVTSARKMDLKGKTFFITGGSSGIGLATATMLAREGAAVIAIMARNQQKLDEAAKEVRAACMDPSKQQVLAIAADVSSAPDLHRAAEQVSKASSDGCIDGLIACAGFSYPGYFQDIPDAEFERQIRVNYLGCVFAAKAAFPYMKKKGGRMMFVSSLAALAGMIGFTAYCPTKYAIRGFAESLQMEMRPYNIRVSIVYPPDVDTPGLAEENKIKPIECRVLSEGSGVVRPTEVASDMISALKVWRFSVCTGLDSNFAGILNAGMTAPNSVTRILLEMFALGWVRLIGLFYLRHYNTTVDSMFPKRAHLTEKKAQ